MKQDIRRYTTTNPCPICGGHQDAPRGTGTRCHGYIPPNEGIAFCGRIQSDTPGPNDTWAHPFPSDSSTGANSAPNLGHANTWDEKAEAVYPYDDEGGNLLYQVLRFRTGSDKTFRQRRPDPRERWIANLDGVRRVLYGLPELRQAIERGDEVFLVEGEKDAENLNEHFRKSNPNAFATCNPQGASNWKREFVDQLAGTTTLTIWRDRDEPGRRWSGRVVADIGSSIAAVRVVESYAGKDASDHLDNGLGLADLLDVTRDVPRSNHRVPLRVITPEEFEEDQVPEAIVEGLAYRRSVTMFNGASKAGKSIMATQLAMSVANGQPFLDLPVQQCKVLVLSLEMSAALVRERIRAIAADTGLAEPVLNEQLYLAAPLLGQSPTLDLGQDEGSDQLRHLIEDSSADLVVLDTLYRFIPGLDLSDNSAMGGVMDTLLRIANDTGVSLFVLHHVRKGEGTGHTSQSGLGAQILGGAANVVVELNPRQEGWQISTASHYGSWDTPVTYRRPRRADGEPGFGCVPCSATEAEAVTTDQIVGLFTEHAMPWSKIEDDGLRGRVAAGVNDLGFTTSGAYVFSSQRKMVEAMQADGLRASEGTARNLAHNFRDDFGDRGLIRIEGPGRAQHFVLISGGEMLGDTASGERLAAL